MEAMQLEDIKRVVAYHAAKYGAERVYLFGSYARGDASGSSDVDLRIDKGSICGFQLAGLLLDIQDSLKLSIDLIPTSSLSPDFIKSIQADEVLLYEADGA